MKKQLHKITSYIMLVLIASLFLSMTVRADAEQQSPATPVMHRTDRNILITKHKILAEKEQQVVKEAVEAVAEIHQALDALEKNDHKKAFYSLQTASGKLDVILAKQPTLALIPTEVDVDVADFQGDAKTVKNAINEADDLLDDGKLQAARQILAELASEIRITTVSMPLGSFPTAIKEAVALIDKGNTYEAEALLNKTLNMLVETTEIIPLPFLRAEDLLDAAAELEHNNDMSKEKNRDEVLKLTDAAKDKLKIAELLSYGDKDDFKMLYTEIDAIKDTLHSEKSAATWKAIKHTIAGLRDKVLHFKK